MGQGKRCELGTFQYLNSVVAQKADAKPGEATTETRQFAYSSFPIDDRTRVLMNRAARATTGVLGVDKIDNTPGVTFVIYIEESVTDLVGTLEQFSKAFRRVLNDAKVHATATPFSDTSAFAVHSVTRNSEH